ncbi:MAG TPA: hypothetical protein VL128_08795 [Candidatus Eisenbacteria bacterium]|nr:hypothetical protein [Candidatus Eisenbacteria bacterium]
MTNWRSMVCYLILALAGIPAAAQGQGTGAPVKSTTQPVAKTAPKKPTKVWTNEDLATIKGSVSVVGEKRSSQNRFEADDDPAEEDGDSQASRVHYYRDAINQLNMQLGSADAKIAQLRAFKAENTSPGGGINPNHGYNMVPIEEQVKQLEEKKKLLQAKIDDLENQARKEGIAPGDLR